MNGRHRDAIISGSNKKGQGKTLPSERSIVTQKTIK
jgi:hypothetical protein